MINVEPEQAILGTILLNNDCYALVKLTAEDFADPVHQRIWARIATRINGDHIASAVTMKSDLEGDEGLRELGRPAYLARLAGAAVSLSAIQDYAASLATLTEKRRVAALLSEQLEALNDPDKDAATVLGAVEAYGLARGDVGGAEVIPFKGALTPRSARPARRAKATLFPAFRSASTRWTT